MQDAPTLVSYLAAGQPPPDGQRLPELDASGELAVDEQDKALYQGSHAVRLYHLRQPRGPFRRSPRWVKSVEATPPAGLVVTDDRVAYSWLRAGRGSLFGRGLLRRRSASHFRFGTLGGQFPTSWIDLVDYSHPQGRRDHRVIRVSACDGGTRFVLEATRLEGDAAPTLASTLVCAVAATRLRDAADLGDFDLTTLEGLTTDRPEPTEIPWGYRFLVPGGPVADPVEPEQAEGMATGSQPGELDPEEALSTIDDPTRLVLPSEAPGQSADGETARLTNPGTTAVADWYPDPLHRFEHRWWDGNVWTATVASRGETSHDTLFVAGDALDDASLE